MTPDYEGCSRVLAPAPYFAVSTPCKLWLTTLNLFFISLPTAKTRDLPRNGRELELTECRVPVGYALNVLWHVGLPVQWLAGLCECRKLFQVPLDLGRVFLDTHEADCAVSQCLEV
jgi:hypothetical protein